MDKNQSAMGFASAAPATGRAVPVLIGQLKDPDVTTKAAHPRHLSVQGWLTIFVCIGAALVYLSLAMQSLVVFLIGDGICVFLAPFVLWGERRSIRAWIQSRGKCVKCGFNLHGIKGPCPQCGRKRIVD